MVEGDVRFGRDVVVRGAVEVRQEGSDPLVIEDGAVLGRARSSAARTCSATNRSAKMIVQRSRLRSMSEPPALLPPPVPTPKAPDMPASFPECRRIRKIRPTAMKTWTTESTVYIGREG